MAVKIDQTRPDQTRPLIVSLQDWRNIALILYVWLALAAWLIAFPGKNGLGINKYYFLSSCEVLLFVCVYVCPRILRRAECVNIIPESLTHKLKFFVTSWLICFAVLLAMYITFYPGGFSPDSIDQYRQAVSSSYNDWHPVLHTLFAFTLPLKLSGGWIGSIVFFQVLVFSLAMAYMLYVLAEYGNRKYSVMVMLYMLLNPATLSIVMYPWKDVTFAVFAMLSMTFAVRVYFTGGRWLERTGNIIVFILVLSCATIFRHNAILFTFPLLFAVMLYAGKKQKIFLVIGVCTVLFMIRGVLYPYLDVKKPGSRVVETTCTPMTVIADAVMDSEDKIDNDIKDFLYSVAPREKWKEYYSIGSFNSVKFRGIDGNPIEEAGHVKIIGMMLRCVREAPFAAVRGFIALTDMVYGIAGRVDWSIFPGVIDNDYGIKSSGIHLLQYAYKAYHYMSLVFFKHIFWHTGILMLAVIIFCLAKLDFRDVKKLCLIMPLFLYNFGTMLFLGGNDFRFFYCTYTVVPLILLLLLRK